MSGKKFYPVELVELCDHPSEEMTRINVLTNSFQNLNVLPNQNMENSRLNHHLKILAPSSSASNQQSIADVADLQEPAELTIGQCAEEMPSTGDKKEHDV